MCAKFSHLDEHGAPRMVDVGNKPDTDRVAVARTEVRLSPKTMRLLVGKALPKGDVLTVAKIAGIQAAKRTPDLIPLCHPLLLTHIDVNFEVLKDSNTIIIHAEVHASGKTGLEMEALTAAQVAALTIYDMCKAVQKDIIIADCRLVRKTGGKSGEYIAPETG